MKINDELNDLDISHIPKNKWGVILIDMCTKEQYKLGMYVSKQNAMDRGASGEYYVCVIVKGLTQDLSNPEQCEIYPPFKQAI